jgi:ATP-dependent helicase/nuclease subunit B
MAVTGSIDRIERHERDGRVRVIDYKTSDRGDPPRSAHFRSAGRDDAWRDAWQRVADGKGELIWKDLQLPLQPAWREDYGSRGSPARTSRCRRRWAKLEILWWTELASDLQAAAERCADGVVEAVRAGRFSPVVEQSPELRRLRLALHRGAAESVAEEGGVNP